MGRRAAVFGGMLCVLLVVAGAAVASHSTGGGPRDFAVGSAANRFFEVGGENRLSVSAHGLGSDATGHVRGAGDFGGPFKVEGEVTCLRVEGNRASIKYRFKHSQGSTEPFEGGGVQVFIEDNGEPQDGQPVDANSTHAPQPQGVFELNATQCDDPALGEPYNPVDSGNYTVHDAG